MRIAHLHTLAPAHLGRMAQVGRAKAVIAVSVLVGATVALSVAGRPGADYRHSDFFQFWVAPRLLLEGADPYDPIPWASIYAREAAAPIASPVSATGRFVYPLWTAVLLLPLGALPLGVAAAAWLVAQLAAVALALRTLVGLVHGGRREAVLLFGLAAAFQPVWLLVGGGNLTGFLLGLFVAALAAVLAREPVRGGLALALLAVKPHPFIVAVPALIAARPGGWWLLVRSALVTVVALLAITIPFGPGWIGEWLASALALQQTTGSNATVWTIGRVAPGGPIVAPLLALGATALLVVWWRRRDREPLTRVGGAVPVSLFLAPHGWSYDHLLLLVPLAVIIGGLAPLDAGRRGAGLVAVAVLAGVLPWALYGIALGRGGEEWSALLPLAFFGLLVLVERWRRGA